MSEHAPGAGSSQEGMLQSKLKTEDLKMFEYLVSKVQESAGQTGGNPISEQDVTRMANSIAVQEERKGKEMNMGYIDVLFSDGEIDKEIDRLAPKLRPEEGTSKMHIADAGGLLHTADSKKELMEKAEREREQGR